MILEIQAYKILKRSKIEDLEEIVNSEIANGWIPKGGVISYSKKFSEHYGDYVLQNYFAQTMIKYKTNRI